jgi:dipeptidyl aminopeptidase/acylaminoacyl peptidase
MVVHTRGLYRTCDRSYSTCMKTTSTRKESARKRTAARGRAAKSRAVTPEDLLKFQFLGNPIISPDGHTIAFTHKRVGEKNEYATNIWTVSTDGGVPQPFTNGNKDYAPRWSPDGKRLAFISGRTKAKPQMYLINRDGGEATRLTNFPEGTIREFRWSPDGTMLAVAFREQDPEWTEQAKQERKDNGGTTPPRVIDDWWYRLDGDGYFNAQRFHLYLVNVTTGEHTKVYDKDTLGFFSFDFSPDSRQLVIATNRDKKALIKPWKDELVRLNITTGKLTRLANVPDGPKSCVRWSPDGKHIAYAGREGIDSSYGTENLNLWICDAAKGNARELTGGEDYCLMAAALSDSSEVSFEPSIQWSPDSKRIYASIGWHGEMHIASIPTRGGKFTFHTSGERIHQMGTIASNGKSMAVAVGSPTKLDEIGVLALGTSSGKAVRMLSDLNGPLLKSLSIVKPKSTWITSADGTKVHVWSILPPGYKRGKIPAVLEIHGGPHAQYGVGMFHEFQVLASAGYAVFYSNPRGSKGYGVKHCEAIRGTWGQADWRDIQAVIEHMKQQPEVDTKRMGVMGGSYGGYMTNWVISHTREFAGAITDRCVSNVVSMMGTSDFTDSPDRYFEGNFWDRPEARWEQSPIKYMGYARTPTLIIHSEGDLRCNIEQAEQVFTVLKLHNVPTRFVRYPRETSHGFSRNGPPDMRLHRLHQILDWWKKYLQQAKTKSTKR